MNTENKQTKARLPLKVGSRIRLIRDVERFSDFLVKAGAFGVCTQANEGGRIAVRMDELIQGAKEWDNEIWWESDARVDFDDDAEVLPFVRLVVSGYERGTTIQSRNESAVTARAGMAGAAVPRRSHARNARRFAMRFATRRFAMNDDFIRESGDIRQVKDWHDPRNGEDARTTITSTQTALASGHARPRDSSASWSTIRA
jgi:hypothetical protein